jgi:membrane-anchored protein YejM (alkaline phosphatase superfamily)
LIIHLPGQQEQVVENKRSSHIDIVPTVLKQFLKCENPISDFSNGYNLFDLPGKRNLVVTSYKDKCYIIDDEVYSTGVTVESYDVDDVNKPNEKFNYPELREIKDEERVFIK